MNNVFIGGMGSVEGLSKKEKELINEIKRNSTVKKGTVSVSKSDNVKYRYDTYIFKYPSAFNSLVKKFEALAGNKKNINIGNYSIYYDRPTFIGQRNGNFTMTELVENI